MIEVAPRLILYVTRRRVLPTPDMEESGVNTGFGMGIKGSFLSACPLSHHSETLPREANICCLPHSKQASSCSTKSSPKFSESKPGAFPQAAFSHLPSPFMWDRIWMRQDPADTGELTRPSLGRL